MIETERKETAAEKARESAREARKQALMNWIPSEIARQPAKFSEYEKTLADDIAGFSISFIRFGDFVCVKMWRNKNETTKAIQLERMPVLDDKGKPTARLKPASITLHPGFAPALGASGVAREQNYGEIKFFAAATGRKNLAVPFYYGEIGNTYGGYQDQAIRVPIDAGMAQPAIDDAISFDGAGVILEMPFGAGQSAYDKLLRAIRKDVAA